MISSTTARPAFRVIDGSGTRPGPRIEVPVPDAPRVSAPELAAEMAEIFALSLLRKCSLADLHDPHCAVWVDGTTRFTLHELLCEMRSLAWYDSSRALPGRDTLSEEAEHRRALRWNADGQLTLRTLFRCGVALRGEVGLSSLWRSDHAVSKPDPVRRPPRDDAPMSAWLDWCERHSGAGLRLPGQPMRRPHVGTLEAMSEDLHRMPAARPFYNAVLAALARGAALDQGLVGSGFSWRGNRLMSLMAEAETRACRAILSQTHAADRLPRPAVTSARMTVWLAREERGSGGDTALYRTAAEELAEAAPNLLYWVSRANKALGQGAARFGGGLFLPLVEPQGHALNPADCATHMAVAGALATLLKAVFDTSRRTQLQPVGVFGPGVALGEEADRMVSNIALSRVVSGGYHPAENVQQMRLGQSIALQILREALEVDNRSAVLSLNDFDGRELRLEAHPRVFGRGFAELRADGAAISWPQEAAPPAAHLTAVV